MRNLHGYKERGITINQKMRENIQLKNPYILQVRYLPTPRQPSQQPPPHGLCVRNMHRTTASCLAQGIMEKFQIEDPDVSNYPTHLYDPKTFAQPSEYFEELGGLAHQNTIPDRPIRQTDRQTDRQPYPHHITISVLCLSCPQSRRRMSC